MAQIASSSRSTSSGHLRKSESLVILMVLWSSPPLLGMMLQNSKKIGWMMKQKLITFLLKNFMILHSPNCSISLLLLKCGRRLRRSLLLKAAMAAMWTSLKCANNGNICTHLDMRDTYYWPNMWCDLEKVYNLRGMHMWGWGICVRFASSMRSLLALALPSHLLSMPLISSAHCLLTVGSTFQQLKLLLELPLLWPLLPKLHLRVHQITFSISPDLLIQLPIEEYDCIQSAPSHRGSKSCKSIRSWSKVSASGKKMRRQ